MGVPVRDPDVHMQKAPPRFAREMNYAIEAYRDKGYTKQQFADLLTLIFKRWTDFSKFFKKDQFSVYDLRYAILEICSLERHLNSKTNLDDSDDFEEERKRPAKRKGQVHYEDE